LIITDGGYNYSNISEWTKAIVSAIHHHHYGILKDDDIS